MAGKVDREFSTKFFQVTGGTSLTSHETLLSLQSSCEGCQPAVIPLTPGSDECHVLRCWRKSQTVKRHWASTGATPVRELVRSTRKQLKRRRDRPGSMGRRRGLWYR